MPCVNGVCGEVGERLAGWVPHYITWYRIRKTRGDGGIFPKLNINSAE